MGGAERQALYLVEYLATLENCDVEVLAFEDGTVLRHQLQDIRIPVHVFPYYFRWPRTKRARTLAELAAFVRFRIKPDALLPFVGIHSKTAAMIWPFTGARFCWWNQQDEGRDLTGTALEKKILRRVSSINSNSEAGKEFLVETYGLESELIKVYNNGTPIPQNSLPGKWRTRLSVGNRMMVTMLANVTQYKDHVTLLKAWTIVKKSSLPHRTPILLLAGHLREEQTVIGLKTLAFELGLSSEDVRFLGPVDEVQSLIEDSDVVVHSSNTEGCPNAICEAMAAGKPVVATNIPGCRQALGSAECLIQPQDAAAMAKLILQLLDSDELRTELGRRNFQRISTHFTIEGMNRFFVGEIERGLGRSMIRGLTGPHMSNA
jgi:glycosyltransferase involved in cell wall biosynthesis